MMLDQHLQKIAPAEHSIQYSDGLFHEATVEWIVSTDQVSSSVYCFAGAIY